MLFIKSGEKMQTAFRRISFISFAVFRKMVLKPRRHGEHREMHGDDNLKIHR